MDESIDYIDKGAMPLEDVDASEDFLEYAKAQDDQF